MEDWGYFDTGWITDIWGAVDAERRDQESNQTRDMSSDLGTAGTSGSVTEEEAGPVEEGNSFWEKAAATLGVGLDYIKNNPWMQQLIRQAGIRIFSDKPSFDWDRFKQAQIDTTVMRSPDYFNQFGNSQVVVDPETGKKTVTGEMAPWLTDMVNAMVSRSASPMNAYQKPEAFNALLGEYIGDREDYFGIPRSGSTTQQHNVGGYGSPVNIDIGGPMSPKAPGVDPTDDGSTPNGGTVPDGGGGTLLPPGELPYENEETAIGDNGWNFYRDILLSQGATPQQVEEAKTLYDQSIAEQREGVFIDWIARNWKNALGLIANGISGNIPGMGGNIARMVHDRMTSGQYGTPVTGVESPEHVQLPGGGYAYREDGTPVYIDDPDAGDYGSRHGMQPDILPGGEGINPGLPGDFWQPNLPNTAGDMGPVDTGGSDIVGYPGTGIGIGSDTITVNGVTYSWNGTEWVATNKDK